MNDDTSARPTWGSERWTCNFSCPNLRRLNNGAAYAVVAMALVLIFKATTLINFAQGEMAMFGAYLVWVFATQLGLPIWIAVAGRRCVSAIVAAGIERVLIRPFDPADHLPLVIITFGLFLAINALAGLIWRLDPRRLPGSVPGRQRRSMGRGPAVLVHGVHGATVLVVLALLTCSSTKTKIGLAFRAVSSNLESCELVGIRVGPTLQFGWALAAAVGTLGACMYVADPMLTLEPSFMVRVLIFASAAAALGGLDSLWGCLAGGLTSGWCRASSCPTCRSSRTR